MTAPRGVDDWICEEIARFKSALTHFSIVANGEKHLATLDALRRRGRR